MGKESSVGPNGNDQGPAEMGLEQGTEDDAHDHGRCGEVGMLHKIADDPKDQGYIDLSHAIVGGVSPGYGDDEDEGEKDRKGDL